MSGGWRTLRPKRRPCPRATPRWMPSCPAAAGRSAAWWKCCSSAPGRMCGNCCCPAWRRRFSQQAGPVVLVARRYEPFGPSLPAQGLPANACCASRRTSPRPASGPPNRPCAAPRWRPCWPGCRRPGATSCGACTWRRSSTSGCCSCSAAWNARHDASPARLRLLVEGVDTLELHILKRRGPPLERPLVLPAIPPAGGAAGGAQGAGAALPGGTAAPAALHRRSHVLDRTAAFT